MNKLLSQVQKIETFSELDRMLSDEFIIFCGSAVSGFPQAAGSRERFLPMVNDATQNFFDFLGDKLAKGEYAEKLMGKYSKLFVKHGKYRRIRVNMKFESFLGYLENIVGEERLFALIKALFLCDNNQYGLCHAAISALLRSGRAKFCLTTNFDNAIENSWAGLKKYNHGDDLSGIFTSPSLIKLHGDVIDGKVKTTTATLALASRLNEYGYLADLLKGKKILVIGYSGVGDIDIAPTLSLLKDKVAMIWLVEKGQRPPSLATHWFESNLFSNDQKENWLIKLATNVTGTVRGSSAGHPNWKGRLKNWFDDLSSSETYSFLQDIFSRSSGWSHVHLFHVSRKLWQTSVPLDFSARDGVDLGFASIQITDYNTALRAFTYALMRVKDISTWGVVIKWIGFSYWRLGRLDDALSTLKSFLDRTELKDTIADEYATAMLYFLEIATDKLRYTTRPNRIKLYNELNIEEYSSYLLQHISQDPGKNLLVRLRILAIQLLVEKSRDVGRIQEIYNELLAIKEWGLAESAARVWVGYDRIEGIKALLYVDKILFERLNLNTIRKSLAAILDAFIPLDSYKISYYLDGPAFGSLKAGVEEWRHLDNLNKWHAAFVKDRIIHE